MIRDTGVEIKSNIGDGKTGTKIVGGGKMVHVDPKPVKFVGGKRAEGVEIIEQRPKK